MVQELCHTTSVFTRLYHFAFNNFESRSSTTRRYRLFLSLYLFVFFSCVDYKHVDAYLFIFFFGFRILFYDIYSLSKLVMQSHNNSHIFMVNGICEYTHRPKIDGRPSDRPTDCDDVHNGDIVRQMNEMQSTYAAVAAAAVVTDKKRYNARRTYWERADT